MYATKIVEDCTKFRTMHKEREVTVIIRNQKLEEENVNNLILYNLFFKQIAKNQRLRFINSFLFIPQSTESFKGSSIWLFYKLTKNKGHHQSDRNLTLNISQKLESIQDVYNLILQDENNPEKKKKSKLDGHDDVDKELKIGLRNKMNETILNSWKYEWKKLI